ncbi:PREDICTED: uncharacterized protein LOC104719358 [Camelina sativa]|uniref:Uncharacterized protein LOC104719358 n=1 Tax=Camelina sativa TaxID=90675 RepID=A0ABM1QIB1_CAMSA|nr:PREDICTED: uncharacterized protein LOC104719358 [Camelina sativa]
MVDGDEMSESLNLRLKAREILVSPSHKDVAIVVDQLFLRKESKQYQTAQALYHFCVANFPDCLALKLLQVFQSSSNGVTRFRSIYQLSLTLTDLRNREFELSLDSLYVIKRVLIPCLTRQETKESDIKILRRIVSCVADNVMDFHKDEWDELGDCIFLLANKEPVKAFNVFLDLPPVYEEFIKKFLKIMLDKAKEVLVDPEESVVEDWSLALQTLVKLGIQFFSTGMKRDVIKNIMRSQLVNVLQSAKMLVEIGQEKFLVRGLEDFERSLSRDMSLYKYTKDQCHFVSTFVTEIGNVREVGTQTKEIVCKINMLFTKPYHQETDQDHGAEFGRDWYDHLKDLSSLEVLEIFASTELEDRSREIAIRRVNVLLSYHTSKKMHIDFSVMRQLQPLLISCLRQQGITDSMFKVLGEVVSHVAYELFKHQDVTWYALRNYIASSKTEFHRAAYIFQCLTMPLEHVEFVVPVIEVILPEISRRINPPTELFVDNSCWVLAFTGAFFAAIHLIEVSSHARYVKEIAHKMIDSVRELVGRGMEVGLVRRAFRDVEGIVKKQLRWYGTSKYKLVKGLLWRLYTIKGMKWESKIVLWRINVIVERGVDEMVKELPENEFDWLNLTDEELE